MGRIHLGTGARRGIHVAVPALLITVALQAVSAPQGVVRASSPPSGILNSATPTQLWTFQSVGGPSGSTDSHTLTIQLPAADAAFYAPDTRQGSANAAVLQITMTWADSSPTQVLSMSVTDHNGNSVGNDTLATTNDNTHSINVFQLQDPTNQTYTVTASNFNGASLNAIDAQATASLQLIDLAGQAQPPNPSGAPGFTPYHIPLSLMPPRPEETTVLHGRAFGEPSIGVDARAGHDQVMYQAGLYTIRATFDDSTLPATASYTDVSFPVTDTASEDAILDVDRLTGRTFVSQLTGACSAGAVSDDDGASWTPSPHPCQTPAGPDHQTIGAGPFAAPLPQGAVYPDAAYYCSQSVATASCALSVDGGLNYGAASPTWTSAQCFGLHGHVKVAPNDGAVYVPDKACGAPECLIVTTTAGSDCHPGFVVSTDNGGIWTLHTINDGHFRYFTTGDPSIGIGSNGTMYYGYGDRDGTAKVVVCTQHGASCSASVDVGAPFHVVNTEMATVVAGDDNRAAFAFLGSTTPGDDQQPSFVGTWDIYVAVTYDGGAHWTTTDATPNAPIQRGCIEFNASCPSSRGTNDQRNLLDFNDLTIDREGRILYAYTDGCQEDPVHPGHGPCATDATRLSGLPTEIEGPAILRQSCGLTLYAQFDSLLGPCTPAEGVPEVSRTGVLVLGGLAVVGFTAMMRRRRRRTPA